VRGHQKTLGKFRTAEEAGAAYDEAALEFHGERAVVNFQSSVEQYKRAMQQHGADGAAAGAGFSSRRSNRHDGDGGSRSSRHGTSDGTYSDHRGGRSFPGGSPRTPRNSPASSSCRGAPSEGIPAAEGLSAAAALSRLEAAVIAKSAAAASAAPWPYELERETYHEVRDGKAFVCGLGSGDAMEQGPNALGASSAAAVVIPTASIVESAVAAAATAARQARANAQAAKESTRTAMEAALRAEWRGVSYLPTSGRWLASLAAYQQDHMLGTFENALDAARAHDIVVRLSFGARGRLNFPWSHYDFLELDLDLGTERRRLRALVRAAAAAAGGTTPRSAPAALGLACPPMSPSAGSAQRERLGIPTWAQEASAKIAKIAPPSPSEPPPKPLPAGAPGSTEMATGVMRWPRFGAWYQTDIGPFVPPTDAFIAADKASQQGKCELVHSIGSVKAVAPPEGDVKAVLEEMVVNVGGAKEEPGLTSPARQQQQQQQQHQPGNNADEGGEGGSSGRSELLVHWPPQLRAAFAKAVQNNGKHFDLIAAEINSDRRYAPVARTPGGSRGDRQHDAQEQAAPKTVPECIVYYYLAFKGSRDYQRWKAARAQALREGIAVPGGSQYGWQTAAAAVTLPQAQRSAHSPLQASTSGAASSSSSRSRGSGSAVGAGGASSSSRFASRLDADDDNDSGSSRLERHSASVNSASSEAEEAEAIAGIATKLNLLGTADDTIVGGEEGKGKFVFGTGLGPRISQPKLKRGEESYCVCRGVGEGWMVQCAFGTKKCTSNGGKDWYHGVCMGLTRIDLEGPAEFVCASCCTAFFESHCEAPAYLVPLLTGLSAKYIAGAPTIVYRGGVMTPQAAGSRRRGKWMRNIMDARARALEEARSRGVSLDMRRTKDILAKWEQIEAGGASAGLNTPLDLGLPPEKQPSAILAREVAQQEARARATAETSVAAVKTEHGDAMMEVDSKHRAFASVLSVPRSDSRMLPNSATISSRSVPTNATEWQRRAISRSMLPPPPARPRASPPPASSAAPSSAVKLKAPSATSTPPAAAPAQSPASPPTPATPTTAAAATFATGDTVEVISRTWPGINKPGGTGRVAGVNADGTYFVKYVAPCAPCWREYLPAALL